MIETSGKKKHVRCHGFYGVVSSFRSFDSRDLKLAADRKVRSSFAIGCRGDSEMLVTRKAVESKFGFSYHTSVCILTMLIIKNFLSCLPIRARFQRIAHYANEVIVLMSRNKNNSPAVTCI